MIVYQINLFLFFVKKLMQNILIIKKYLQFQDQIFLIGLLKMIFSFLNIIIVGAGQHGVGHGNTMTINLHSGQNGNIPNSGNIFMIIC